MELVFVLELVTATVGLIAGVLNLIAGARELTGQNPGASVDLSESGVGGRR